MTQILMMVLIKTLKYFLYPLKHNYMAEKLEFTDMSDYPQNGFGLKDIDRDEADYTTEPIYDDVPEHGEPDLQIEEITEQGTFTVVNRGNFACTVDGSATFSPNLTGDSTIGSNNANPV